MMRAEYPRCPACESEIEIDEMDVDLGENIGCPECGVTLQVIGTSPIDLDIAEVEITEWKDN